MKFKFRIPKDVGATYKREVVGKAENKAKFFAGAAFVTVVVFLIFGIRPLALTTAENRKVLNELRTIESRLKEKVEKISSSSAELERLSEQIEILYQKIPKEVELEEYLEYLVLAAARSGFVMQRFRQNYASDGTIFLEIELTGNIASLPKLIESVETSPRFTSVKDVRTTTEDAFTNVRMEVQIYTL